MREDFEEHGGGVGHGTQKLAEAVGCRDDARVVGRDGDPLIFMRRIEDAREVVLLGRIPFHVIDCTAQKAPPHLRLHRARLPDATDQVLVSCRDR